MRSENTLMLFSGSVQHMTALEIISWFRLWELGVRGRMWRVIKDYDIKCFTRGKNPNHLICQGVAQGSVVLLILF